MTDALSLASRDSRARRNSLAQLLLQQSASNEPIRAHSQGIAKLAQALIGGYMQGAEEKRQRDSNDALANDIGNYLGAQALAAPSSGPTTSASAPVAPASLMPRFAQAEAQYGLPKGYLTQTASIESGFNPNAKNPNSSASGLFQFVNGTARQYGLTNPFDPAASTDAAARLAADNKAHLTRALGREPSAGELYLAHQQGAGGASKLLTNPNARAVDIVGLDAVRLNGGDPNMTAGQFAQRWVGKLASADMPAPGAAPASAETGQEGFAVPPAPASAMTGANFDAITNGQPLAPAFQSEGLSQPWMGSTYSDPAALAPQVAQAPLPPPRPTDLAMPQADMPAAEAVPAMGQFAPVTPPVVDPNSPDGGMRALQAAEAQGGSSPFSGLARALAGNGAPPTDAPVPPAGSNAGQAMAPQAGVAPAANPQNRMAALAVALARSGDRDGAIRLATALMSRDPTDAEMKRLQLDKARREAEGAPLEAEGRRLDIEAKRKSLGKVDAPTVQRIKQPDGSEVAVQWDQGKGAWVPLVAPEGGNAVKAPQKLTEAQSKDLTYFNRGVQALEAFEKDADAYANGLERGASQLPGGNYLNSDQFQRAKQSGRNFLASILRKDSGAAITENEEKIYGDVFLPQPGDKPGVLAQKREARRQAIEAVKGGLGTAEVLARGSDVLKAPATTAVPDRAALEAEARRRGLIK